MTDKPRIAILVDADNVSAEQIAFALEDAAGRGQITIRRAFGRLSALKGRERALADMGFAAEVALPAAKKKDTADLLLGLYAVKLAARGAVEQVALVSSDSDFATIASAVAEAGIGTIGYARAEAPPALQAACAVFVPFPGSGRGTRRGDAAAEKGDLAKARRIIQASLDGQGGARPQALGQQLNRGFDGDYRKAFEVRTLQALLKKLGGFDMVDLPDQAGVVAKRVVARRG